MTVAAGMLCRGGIVLGADTEESLGDLRLRVHKIPTHFKIPAMVTGSCENGRLMDTAVERIFDGLQDTSTDAAAVDKVLKEVMVGLYRREFRVYPEPKSTWMNLLVALKPEEEHAAMAWSIDCSAVRRMKDMEIAGGEN